MTGRLVELGAMMAFNPRKYSKQHGAVGSAQGPYLGVGTLRSLDRNKLLLNVFRLPLDTSDLGWSAIYYYSFNSPVTF